MEFNELNEFNISGNGLGRLGRLGRVSQLLTTHEKEIDPPCLACLPCLFLIKSSFNHIKKNKMQNKTRNKSHFKMRNVFERR